MRYLKIRITAETEPCEVKDIFVSSGNLPAAGRRETKPL